MQTAHCPNCGKSTVHKRILSAGTILRTFMTGGLSLLAVPVYGKHCIICGLTPEEAAPLEISGSESVSNQAQGWLVLLGVIFLLLLAGRG
jgi:hypothetical protein